MPVAPCTDLPLIHSLVTRCFAGRGFVENPFRKPLVLAGVFFPTDGYGLLAEQFMSLAGSAPRMSFLVVEIEYSDVSRAHSWLCENVSFDEYRASAMTLAVNTAYIQLNGEWAVIIAEDSFGWIGMIPPRLPSFYNAYTRMEYDIESLRQVGGEVLPQTSLNAMLAAVQACRRTVLADP